MSTQPKTYLTPEQYLEIERKAEFKSEYWNGEMFAMSGAKINHNRIAGRLLSILDQQLAGKDCEPLGSDQRVLVPGTGLYTYPDLVVVCGEATLSSADNLVNPVLIAEVLSPSTEAYDRGRKFEHYQTIESLREYVLCAQDRVHVDLYTRQPDGAWLLRSASRLEDSIELASIGCRISLAALYERVKFDSEV